MNAISRLKKHSFALLLFCWAAFLLLKGLDFAPLWSDEASTTWYARSLIHSGLPSAWDGKNVYAHFDGLELNDQFILAYIPWLQYSIAAGSMVLFGDSVWAARLPFALIALLSAVFFFFAVKKIFSEQKYTWFASILYIHSLPFLVYSRNCRYFALLICFASAWLWIMTNFENKKRIIALSFLFVLFLHTHYFIAACFVLALGITGLSCAATKKLWKEHFTSLFIAACFFLPWFFFFNPWNTSFVGEFQEKSSLLFFKQQFLTHLLIYFQELNYNLIFPALLACLLPFVFWKAETIRRKYLLASVVFFVSFMLALIILDPSRVIAVRYTVMLIPLSILLWTFCLEGLGRQSALQIAAVCLIILTDLSSLPMFTKQSVLLNEKRDQQFYHPKALAFQRFPFLGYWNLIWNDFPRSYDIATNLIRKHVPKGACVSTYPDHHRYPLMPALTHDYQFCSQLYPKPQSRWTHFNNPKFPDSFFARPQDIESWVVVFGNEINQPAPNYDELALNSPGLEFIDVANWDCTTGVRPEFMGLQTEELRVPPGDPKAIRLYHYIPPQAASAQMEQTP